MKSLQETNEHQRGPCISVQMTKPVMHFTLVFFFRSLRTNMAKTIWMLRINMFYVEKLNKDFSFDIHCYFVENMHHFISFYGWFGSLESVQAL
ncbi:UNVERIFIED_CONTAM: hypothetical protein NCL1_24166 [Trichonephila clavipes]